LSHLLSYPTHQTAVILITSPHSMKRSFRLLAPALVLAAVTAPLSAAEKGKPNILLIIADDLGWGELGVQGFAKDIPTPHIDALAKGGVRFTSGYVSGPYCSPTRAGLLTGRYQQRFGHEFNPGPNPSPEAKFGLPLSEKTLADRLKPAGYTTGWFGKSHLGNDPDFHPQRRGFDAFFGFLGGAHTYLAVGGGGARNSILRGTEPVKEIDYTTDAFAREAVAFIEQKKSEPWFVYLPFNAVHGPLEATEKYLARFKDIADPKRKKFAAMLSALDDAVGSVVGKVRETGQEENTLIFFISDNGGPTPSITSGNGPLRGFKAQTWEGGIRVPWIVNWKGRIPAGKVDDRPVIQLDVFPTVLAAAAVDIPADAKIDGVNLLPYLTGEKAGNPHDALYWRFGSQIAVRKGEWKLVKAPGAGAEQGRTAETATTEGAHLYNVSKDIGEQTNLADKEPEKVKELAAAWDQWNRDNVPARWLPSNRGGARKAAAVAATDAKPAASQKGPWKSGDVVEGDAAPQVANRGFTISAEIEASAPNGVIVAQGGKGNGYSLYLENGKVAFGLRAGGTFSSVVASQPLPEGRRKVEARISADGAVKLLVDGNPAGEGKAATLLKRQPREGLTVGSDGKGAVGEYTAPHEFSGKVENVSVQGL
jgi:arylsulfatase A-like enzyme